MLKSVIKSIGWIKTIIFLSLSLVLFYAGYDGSKVFEFYQEAPFTELSDLTKSHQEGDWIKLGGLDVDFKYRVRGLKDKTVAENVQYLIPLREKGENPGTKIKFLYVMPDNGFIGSMFDDYMDGGDVIQNVDELVVEWATIDDLAGDIPSAVRNNRHVGNDVIILWHKMNDPSWAMAVVFGGVFLFVWLTMFVVHFIKVKKSQPKFFN
ncbi:MAG: hypothetical protein QNK23_10810 [Crocinitomicaceae bacterium]|nr:hypothetical protein [Crocinitomicaceae bacterium]